MKFHLSSKNEEELIQNEIIKAHLQNAYNKFFPQKELQPFKIVNNSAQITINGQKYFCTLVEGFDGDEKIKYWMINDKPGVFAQIIQEKTGKNGHYIIYQLLDIESLKK